MTSDLCEPPADGPGAESRHQPHIWRHFVTDKKTDHLMQRLSAEIQL